MNEKWYIVWRRFVRQVFCWHSFIAAEPEGIHLTCRKCDWSYTNWEAEADRWREVAMEWRQKYLDLQVSHEARE